MSGWRNNAFASMSSLQSSAMRRPLRVTISGLISIRLASRSRYRRYSPSRIDWNCATASPSRPMPKASSRHCQGCRPAAGCTVTARIRSGVSWATCSISMPPAADATTAMRPRSRLSVRLRYSSRSISEPVSTYTLSMGRPAAPVCFVTSRWPSIAAAAALTASGSRATLTPPALPRPPACTCALTTHSAPPSARAAASASSAVAATSPSGTGMP